MKSLQNKLNLIKEGKGNKELFLKEARIMFPNVVTSALTFDQAIHNLTERGILSEGFIGVSAKKQDTPDWFKIFNENVKADLKSVDKDVEKLETTGYDYKEVKDSNNLSMESILSGYYAEMKDPKNVEKTEAELKEMVVKNLTKDPLHYMKDGAFGVKGAGYTDEHPGLGKPKEVTGKFKSSGMEPVKLNERMYADSDGDYEHDLETEVRANEYYDKGMEAYSEGDYLKADRYYKAALKAGAWLGWTQQDLPPYGTEHLEEASNSTPNELASYIGILQNQINAEKDPKKLKMLKQDLEDTKQELAKRREAKKTKNGMSEYLGGRLEVPRNYGMDFDDEEDDYEDEDEEYYDEEGNIVPLRSPLHPRNRNMGEGNKKLKEGYGMSKEEAMSQAEKNSLEGYVQHVEDNGDGTYNVSDWYDSDKTVASYENGVPLNENEKLEVAEALAEAKHPMEKAVREIEKKSELAKAEAKVNQIQELISELEGKLTMTEAEGVSDMVDKKKVKEIQRNIKFLEAKKKRYDKEKARLEGKYGEKKKEIMDEVGEPKKTMRYKDAVKEMLKRKGLKY